MVAAHRDCPEPTRAPDPQKTAYFRALRHSKRTGLRRKDLNNIERMARLLAKMKGDAITQARHHRDAQRLHSSVWLEQLPCKQ